MAKKQRDVYEVIIVDARDADKEQPESSSGLVFTEKDARQALYEMQTGCFTGYVSQLISWRIERNGIIIDQS